MILHESIGLSFLFYLLVFFLILRMTIPTANPKYETMQPPMSIVRLGAKRLPKCSAWAASNVTQGSKVIRIAHKAGHNTL